MSEKSETNYTAASHEVSKVGKKGENLLGTGSGVWTRGVIKSVIDRTMFSREIGVKAARKLKARRNSTQGVWFGLGMMGLVGWSVVVPTLLGAALGIWLDNRHQGSYSWTLMLLVIGLVIGCLNAWHWVAKEDKEIREEQEDKDE